MSDPHKTFGCQLEQFALTVDIVDERTFSDLWGLVEKYLSDELKIEYFALLCEDAVDDKPGLRTERKSGGGSPSYRMRRADDSYNGWAAYSFGESKRLWVVNPDKKPLAEEAAYRDFWSDVRDLPQFDRVTDDSIRTAILIPLRRSGRPFATLDLESTTYQEATQIALQELDLIGDTIARLLSLRDVNKSQRQNTQKAITSLQRSRVEESWPQLSKPKLFVASSDNAKNDVMGQIRQVLDRFGDDIEVIFWKEMSDSGDINQQILRAISSAKFGLCYFSEPADDGAPTNYQDNPNVVFEAGMLQALTNAPVAEPSGWIPIRESNSPKIPFDFATQRLLHVTRTANGELISETFEAELERRVESLLGK